MFGIQKSKRLVRFRSTPCQFSYRFEFLRPVEWRGGEIQLNSTTSHTRRALAAFISPDSFHTLIMLGVSTSPFISNNPLEYQQSKEIPYNFPEDQVNVEIIDRKSSEMPFLGSTTITTISPVAFKIVRTILLPHQGEANDALAPLWEVQLVCLCDITKRNDLEQLYEEVVDSLTVLS